MEIKGKRGLSKEGYVLVYPPKGSRYRTANWEFEHRLVVEEHLGRELLPHEIVHHKNEDKTDNRIENLELLDKSTHGKKHAPLLGEFVPCTVCGSTFYLSRAYKKRGQTTCSRVCGSKTPVARISQSRNLKPPRSKLVCKRGHTLEGDNLRLLKRRGRIERICRICVRLRNRESKHRKRKKR